jgi:hypothetical protein
LLGANGSTLGVAGYAVNDGNGGANYTVSLTNASGTINPRPVTVTADPASKLLGTSDSLPFSYRVSNLVSGESLSGALTRDAGEIWGSYAIRQGTVNGALNPNYAITYIPGFLIITRPTNTGTPTSQVNPPANNSDAPRDVSITFQNPQNGPISISLTPPPLPSVRTSPPRRRSTASPPTR